MTVKQEKLVDKVRKLIKKAEGTQSQAEADAFMAKANELLLKHNLSMSSIDLEERSNSIHEMKKAVTFGEIKSEGNKWETLLMGVLCVHNMCDSIIHTKRYVPGGTISIIGKEDNIETVLYLYSVAQETIRRLSKKAYKEYRDEVLWSWEGELTEKELLKAGHLSNRMPLIRNYLKGAVLGLNKKLQLQTAILKKETGIDKQRFDLMIVDNRAAIDLYKEQTYKNLGKTRVTTIADQGAYQRGMRDGKNINLNKGIAGTQNAVPKQLR